MAEPLKMLKLKPTAFQFIQELKIAAPPKRVWKALLDGAWFKFDPKQKRAYGKFEPWVGGRFYGEFPDGSAGLRAIITYIEPNKLLRLAGPMGLTHLPVSSVFIFELNDKGKAGTLLRFCQRTFGYLDKDVQKRMRAGWNVLLPNLKAESERSLSRAGRG